LAAVPRPTTSRPVGLPVLCAAECGNSRDDGADATLLFMLPPSQTTSLSTFGRLAVTFLPPSSSASLPASLPNTTFTYWRVGVAADAFPRFRNFRSEASLGMSASSASVWLEIWYGVQHLILPPPFHSAWSSWFWSQHHLFPPQQPQELRHQAPSGIEHSMDIWQKTDRNHRTVDRQRSDEDERTNAHVTITSVAWSAVVQITSLTEP